MASGIALLRSRWPRGASVSIRWAEVAIMRQSHSEAIRAGLLLFVERRRVKDQTERLRPSGDAWRSRCDGMKRQVTADSDCMPPACETASSSRSRFAKSKPGDMELRGRLKADRECSRGTMERLRLKRSRVAGPKNFSLHREIEGGGVSKIVYCT